MGIFSKVTKAFKKFGDSLKGWADARLKSFKKHITNAYNFVKNVADGQPLDKALKELVRKTWDAEVKDIWNASIKDPFEEWWYDYYTFYSEDGGMVSTGYLPDPIAEFAAMAVALEAPPDLIIRGQLNIGRASKLLRAYNYSKSRMSYVAPTWSFSQTSLSEIKVAKDEVPDDLKEAVGQELVEWGLDTKTMYVPLQYTFIPSYDSPKFNEYMATHYGLKYLKDLNFNQDLKVAWSQNLVGHLEKAHSMFQYFEDKHKVWIVGYELTNDLGDGTPEHPQRVTQKPLLLVDPAIDHYEDRLKESKVPYKILDKIKYEPEKCIGLMYASASKPIEFDSDRFMAIIRYMPNISTDPHQLFLESNLKSTLEPALERFLELEYIKTEEGISKKSGKSTAANSDLFNNLDAVDEHKNDAEETYDIHQLNMYAAFLARMADPAFSDEDFFKYSDILEPNEVLPIEETIWGSPKLNAVETSEGSREPRTVFQLIYQPRALLLSRTPIMDIDPNTGAEVDNGKVSIKYALIRIPHKLVYDTEHYMYGHLKGQSIDTSKPYSGPLKVLNAIASFKPKPSALLGMGQFTLGTATGSKMLKLYPAINIKHSKNGYMIKFGATETGKKYIQAFKNKKKLNTNNRGDANAKPSSKTSAATQKLRKEAATDSQWLRIKSQKPMLDRRMLMSPIEIKQGENEPPLKYSAARVSRDFNYYANLLGLDIAQTVAGYETDSNASKMKYCSFNPGVFLTSEDNDASHYWYEFWKYMYFQLKDGGESYFFEDYAKTKAPLTYTLAYSSGRSINPTDFNGYDGTLGFCFISKLVIEDPTFNLNPLPNKRRRYAILRGEHTAFNKDNAIRPPIKLPPEESWHKLKSGTEIRVVKTQELNLSSAQGLEAGAHDASLYTVTDTVVSPETVASIKAAAHKYAKKIAGDPPQDNDDWDHRDQVKKHKSKYSSAFHKYMAEHFPGGLPKRVTNILYDFGEHQESALEMIKGAWSYTFFCKRTGKNKVTAYAVAGMMSVPKMYRYRKFFLSNLELYWLAVNNYQKRVIKNDDFTALDYKKTVGSGHKDVVNVKHLCFLPLDYNVIRRISKIELERMAPRLLVSQQMYTQNGKQLKGWVAQVISVAGIIVGTVVSIITENPAPLLWAIAIQAAQAMGLFGEIQKALGLSDEDFAIFKVIVAIVMIAAGNTSGITDAMGLSSQAAQMVVSTGVSMLLSAPSEYMQAQTHSWEAKTEAENKAYKAALESLEEKTEEIKMTGLQYNAQSVLAAKYLGVKDNETPSEFFARTLETNPNKWVSLDAMISSLSDKLTVDPWTFDLEKSTDFQSSFKENS